MENKTTEKNSIWDSRPLWMIISVFLAITIWVYITSTVGDVIEETYEGIPVEFVGVETLRDKEGLLIVDPSVNTISVTLQATRLDFSKITSSNLVATIDVSKVTNTGEVTNVPEIKFPNGADASAFTNISTNPSTVSYTVDRISTKTIEVRGKYVGDILDGYLVKEPSFDPDTVTIRGPAKELANIEYAYVEINRDDLDASISFESTYDLKDVDGKTVELGNISLDSETVLVDLVVETTKEVPLTVNIIDGGGATSANTKIVFEPSKVTISGDAKTLDGINNISVGTIDLSTFESSYEEVFPIVLDNSVSNITGTKEVKVTVSVIGLSTQKYTVSNINVTNAPENRNVEIITESLDVVIRGTYEQISEIKAANIRAVVDLLSNDGTKGVIAVNAKIYVDGVTGVGAVGIYPVYINIK